MTPVHYLPVDALVPHGTSALASLPPQAERSLVLVVRVGAAQSAEGTIASQKSELNFNYPSILSGESQNLWHMPASFLAKLEDGGGTLAKWLNRFIFSSPPVLKCSVMSYFILPWNNQVIAVVVCRKHGTISPIKTSQKSGGKQGWLKSTRNSYLNTGSFPRNHTWRCDVLKKFIFFIPKVPYVHT